MLCSKGRNSTGFHLFDVNRYETSSLCFETEKIEEISPKQIYSTLYSTTQLDVPTGFLEIPFLGSINSIASDFDDSIPRCNSESKSRFVYCVPSTCDQRYGWRFL